MAQTIEQQQAAALISYARDAARWLYRYRFGWGVISKCKGHLEATLIELESAMERNGRQPVLGAWDNIRRSSDPYDGSTREVLEWALDGKLGRLYHLSETPWEM